MEKGNRKESRRCNVPEVKRRNGQLRSAAQKPLEKCKENKVTRLANTKVTGGLNQFNWRA